MSSGFDLWSNTGEVSFGANKADKRKIGGGGQKITSQSACLRVQPPHKAQK